MPMQIPVMATAQQNNRQRVADGNPIILNSLRDGALVEAAWLQALALEGKLYAVNVGSGTTGVAGATSFTQLQPQLNIDVPAGVSILPLSVNLYLTASTGTANVVKAAISQGNLGAGTSSAVTNGPFGYRSDNLAKSACTAKQIYTASGTALTNQTELWTDGYAFADATGGPVKQFSWWPAGPIFPVLVGPSSFQVYWVGTTTAPSALCSVVWAELPSSAVA